MDTSTSRETKIKGILFDLDGTLIKSMEDHFLAWKRAVNDFGANLQEQEYYPLEGTSLLEIAKKFCREKGLDESLSSEMVKKKEEYYLDQGLISFYPHVEEIIGSLSRKGLKMGIITASSFLRMQKMLPSLFLNQFITVIGGEKTRGKPFPDPYLKGLEELKISKEECIAVENAPLGIKSAKSAGLYCIAIASTIEKEKLIEADEIIDKFEYLKTSKKLNYLF